MYLWCLKNIQRERRTWIEAATVNVLPATPTTFEKILKHIGEVLSVKDGERKNCVNQPHILRFDDSVPRVDCNTHDVFACQITLLQIFSVE